MISRFEQRVLRDQILDRQIPLLHLTIAQVALDADAVVRDEPSGLRNGSSTVNTGSGFCGSAGRTVKLLTFPNGA